ncbi:unnamed protein product [Cylicocyclus nassatus]|uniref:Uncharacterized protein n=1 Tax=Cylicocyclus nassatus TaxID=53992 RepID=A0AA36GR75_CYLNA|nr:unnamed protein product [Cylicocyclus nassatus]
MLTRIFHFKFRNTYTRMEIKIKRFLYFIVTILIPSTLWFFCGRKRSNHSPIANTQKNKKSSIPSSTPAETKSSKSSKKKKRKSLILDPTQHSDKAIVKTCSIICSFHSPPPRAEAERSRMVSSAEWWSKKTSPKPKSSNVLQLSRTQSGEEDVLIELPQNGKIEETQKSQNRKTDGNRK